MRLSSKLEKYAFLIVDYDMLVCALPTWPVSIVKHVPKYTLHLSRHALETNLEPKYCSNPIHNSHYRVAMGTKRTLVWKAEILVCYFFHECLSFLTRE